MATAAPVAPSLDPMPPRPVHRFTVEQYHQMIETGVLPETNKLEFIEGWIIPKMVKGIPHDYSLDLTNSALNSVLTAMWRVRIQSAITLSDSEPEPDAAVVRNPASRYARSHPRPADIGMLVEVAESSLLFDRVDKGRVYARARIPVYWVVNLVDGWIEVYTEPRRGKVPAYRKRRDYGPTESVPVILNGETLGSLPVHDLLP